MNRRHFLWLLSAGLGTAAGCGKSIPIPDVSLPSAELKPDLLTAFDFGDKTLLRYKFKKGEELRWNVQQTLKMKNIIGGLEENIETISRSVKIWTALEVDAQGAAIFEYRVEDVDMRRVQSGRETVYNSRRDTVIPPEYINLEGKIGIPLAHIKIDPQGNTIKKPLREYEGSVTENRIVILLPNEPISIGSAWSEAKQVELQQPDRTVKKIRVVQEYTLEKIHSGLATIKCSSFPLTPLTPLEESQLFEHFVSGTMELDLEAGHFLRQESTIDKMVVGIQRASDSIRYLSRLTECCCGRRACDICG